MNNYRFIKLVFQLILMLGVCFNSHATHLRAGEIKVEKLDCSSNGFKITLIIYTNSGSSTSVEGKLFFGDGQSVVNAAGVGKPIAGLGSGVGVYTFVTTHLYSSNGTFTVSYLEENRNSGILNLANSVNTPFYIQTKVLVDITICNSSPSLTIPPIDQACANRIFYHSSGAYDAEGDSLAYRLAIPLSNNNQTVSYKSPIDPSFYPLGFLNENKTGIPTFLIDAQSGIITWDAPGLIGSYVISFVVEEWRMVNDKLVLLSETTRDMQIAVEDCINNRPDLVIPSTLCVVAGQSISKVIVGFDPDGNDVLIEPYSGVFKLADSPAIFSPYPSQLQPSSNAKVNFKWNTNCSHVREQPYSITFKITDNPAKGPRLVNFKTWLIKVMAPQPIFSKASLDVVKRSVNLGWNPYPCGNAIKMKIYRRVSKVKYEQSLCDIGLPKSKGYSLIAEVPLKDANGNSVNEYLDDNQGKGLDPGAVYCYRLLAYIPTSGGVLSKVSLDTCIAPILAKAPVITNVSVTKTDAINGSIIVNWSKPFDLNKASYLSPYKYEILRANGLAGNTGLTQVQKGLLTDTTFSDHNFNTVGQAYNYRIVLLASTPTNPIAQAIDTSAIASSVLLSAKPLPNKIEIKWIANTPWSNQIDKNRFHLIYRGDEGVDENNLVLIDSVNVVDKEDGFTYLDNGNFNNSPLSEYKLYQYKIKTRGSYGNPKIKSPQENYSQTVIAGILDNTPPCQPNLSLISIDCDEFKTKTPCNQVTFENTIEWTSPTDLNCKNDTYSYNVYAADFVEDRFVLIGNIKSNQFSERDLNTLKRCYQIRAVDRAGNLSEPSPTVCNDNCPSLDFPNVLTPNGDGFNDSFKIKCSFFAKSFSIEIFNRWGQKIYSSNSDSPSTWSWSGTNKDGAPLEASIFYYVANVTFDTSDKSKRQQVMKGWIHLIR